jgi:hypothetical protein
VERPRLVGEEHGLHRPEAGEAGGEVRGRGERRTDGEAVGRDPPDVEPEEPLLPREWRLGGQRVVRRPGPVSGAGRGAPQSTFTRATSFPLASWVWMAQARHGSKEWTVRRASRGLSGTAMGLPTREAS